MGKKKHRPEPTSFQMEPIGVDTHAHLDLDAFDADREEVLARSIASGINRIGNVFLGPTAYARGKSLFDAYPGVFFLLGIHPHDAASCTADSLDALREAFISDSRLRALREIGLDFYYDRSPRGIQITVLQEQLVLAKELDLPVAIHSREAEEDVLRIMADLGFMDRKVLWHCFGGTAEMAERIVGYGWTLSIPGTVTFRKNKTLQDAVARIPSENLVLETDCPFLSPEPYRGKRNEPAFTVFTAGKIAEIRGEDVETLWRKCAQNAFRFFSLEDGDDDAPGKRTGS
ncbi:MAG: TatD family hydrolase [Desulfovibrionales bacterium]